MEDIIDLSKIRLNKRVGKGFRNWESRFGEAFGVSTRLSNISKTTLTFLAKGHGDNSFYLYDLIMGFLDMGSGFEIHELESNDKMVVMDQYLFLLDRIRFEYMKRLGWFESYPGEEYTIVELILRYDQLAPGIQAKLPVLRTDHPQSSEFDKMNTFEKEEFIRRLIPKALQEIDDYSNTL